MLARGAFVSALVSIFLMPAVLCVCEPIFSKTSWHWKTPLPPSENGGGKPAPEKDSEGAAYLAIGM